MGSHSQRAAPLPHAYAGGTPDTAAAVVRWRYDAALRKADAARDARRWADAVEGYRAVLALNPGTAATWIQYGHALKEQGRIAAAKSAYERALKLDPSSDGDTHLQLGHLFKLSGEISRAVQMYSEALRLQPASADAKRELRELGAQTKVKGILWEARLARQIARGLAILLRPLRLCAAYLRRGYGLARAIFARVLTAGFSRRGTVQLNAARTAMGRADWVSAVRLLEHLRSIWPRNALIAHELEHAALRGARELEAGGQLVNACRLWVSFARVTGDVQKAARNIARCARNTTKGMSDQKSIADALRAWNDLATIDPDSREARRGIAWCQASLARWAEQSGDPAGAESHWAACVRALPGDPAGTEGLRRARAAAEACSSSVGHGPGTGKRDTPDSAKLLYEEFRRAGRQNYRSRISAAALLLEAGAPRLALEFAEEALATKPAAEAAVLALQCDLATKEYVRAAERLRQSVEAGWLASIPREDSREVLLKLHPPALPRTILDRLFRSFESDNEMRAILAPHLVAADAHETVLAAARQASADDIWWPDAIVIGTEQYLWNAGDRAFVLGWLSKFWARSGEFKARVRRLADKLSADEIEVMLERPIEPAADYGAVNLVLAAHFAEQDQVSRGIALLEQIASMPAGEPNRLRNESRELFSDTVAALLGSPACTAILRSRLAKVVVSWLPEQVRAFFAGAEFELLRSDLKAAAASDRADVSSRRGAFRERFFNHYLERREGIDPGSLSGDPRLCDAALRYFAAHASTKPVEELPVPAWLRERLTKPCLRLGVDGNADVLMTWAFMREARISDLDTASSAVFEDIAGWYLATFVPENHIPSRCLSPDLARYFQEQHTGASPFGVPRTRFLDVMHAYETAAGFYRVGDALDRLFFVLRLIATTLPKIPQYRVFLGDALTAENRAEYSFLDECISAMRGKAEQQSGVPCPAGISPRNREPASASAAPHVMLIGHGAADSGLGRNFRMLGEAIAAKSADLETLVYETEGPAFAQSLREWYGRAGSAPIAIIAVNAQDIPAIFAKDRYGVLNDCRAAGFLLWETSRVPRVQELGVQLLDEVWAPTRYVAGVYAPLAPTHVIGKGLFSADEGAAPDRSAAKPSNRFRFVTVFDFHSSIERKNPLASVLAFKQAFRAGEDVELVVKASNVDPQHPSNALGQWERLCAASADDSRIHIVTERYTNEQMKALISESSCVVSLHRSEGFGYLMSDAMTYGVPVIATGYSGNADFCTQDTCFPVPYRLVPVVSMGMHWESDGAEWADPDIDAAADTMARVFQDYPAALERARTARRFIFSAYSKERFAATLAERIGALANKSMTRGSA